MTLGRGKRNREQRQKEEERLITFPLADVWEKETLLEMTASKSKFPGCQSQSHFKTLLMKKETC